MPKESLSIWILRHDNLAKAIGLGVVSVILLLVGLLPSMGRVGELRKKIVLRSKEESRLTQKMRVISTMDKTALTSRVEVLDKALPPRKDVVVYLATVDGLSRELGLSFAGISLSPGDVTEASASSKVRKSDIVSGVHVLETEVKINGSREKLYEFLRALERTSPLMQIKNVQMSSLGAEEDNYALALNLGMLWASRDEGKITGVVELFTEKEESYFHELAVLRTFDTRALTEQEGVGDVGKFDLFMPITPLQSESLPQELVQE